MPYNSKDFEHVFSFVPYFESKPEYAWGGGDKSEDGIITMPYPRYDDTLHEFVQCVYDSKIMLDNYLEVLEKPLTT